MNNLHAGKTKFRILIIEDDAMMRDVLRDTVSASGHEAFLCEDGRSGLSAVAADKPDLVVLDVNLPDLSGHEVCKAIKTEPSTRHIPVLMLTGEARQVSERVEGLDVGAEDYLFKPISPKVLMARIESIIKLSSRPTN